MKRTTYIIAGFIFLASVLSSQSIRITKPLGGDEWLKNTGHSIQWITSGEMSDKVKIRLFNAAGSTRIMDIANNEDNDGEFTCNPNMFNSIRNGGYRIKVRANNSTISDMSAIFYIGPLPTIDNTVDIAGSGDDNNLHIPPAKQKLLDAINNTKKLNINLRGNIEISYPNKGTNWRLKLGDIALPFPIRVQWEKSALGKHENRVKIFLNRRINDRYMRKNIVLDANAPNSGLFTGSISRNLITSVYTITIKTLGGKLLAESELFHITNAENDSN